MASAKISSRQHTGNSMGSIYQDGKPRPIAHMGYEGSRHMVPDRLPTGRREKTVGLRVIDLGRDTVDNIQRMAGSLKRLDMSDLKLESISDEVTEGLFNLEKIDLNCNKLHEQSFPENFKDMENLFEFSAHDNILTQIPKVLRKLKNLNRIKLSCNRLQKVDGLEKLKRLQVLVLDDNSIDTLTKEFFINLKRLELLHCAENRITGIPGEIRLLRNLRDLDISDNNLTYIPPEVFLLPRLEVLNASCNQISRIPTLNLKGQHKKKLHTIDLSDNLLVRFPSHLMFMADTLDLGRNKIKTIPLNLMDKLDQIPDLHLFLNENPMTIPPQEVCDCGLRSIIQYFMEVKSEMKIFQGLKILVLGSSDQGKTSLIQSIVDQQTRMTEDERTTGVDSYEHSIDQDIGNPLGQHLDLSFWDFSGNPRYMFQHQFFMQQPALVLLVFNMADYSDADFKSRIGRWIDWIIARSNKIIALPVGTHSDKLSAKKVKQISESVLNNIDKYIKDIKASIQREIKRIESRQYISPALSEQLKLYVNLTKLETVVYDEVIPISSKTFKGFTELEEAITKMAENKEIFPNVLRQIPSLWGEVQNFVDDRGYAMQIPMMEWSDYVELVTSKFGMRHLIQAITIYMHDIGKVVWFHDHPHLKNFVFLRPSWLTDIFKAIFRHDVAEIDYTIEESFRQNNITPGKLEKMKKDVVESAILERDYIKCLWSHVFQTDMNRPVLEVLAVLLEHFHIGYAVSSRLTRRTSTVSKASSIDSSGHGKSSVRGESSSAKSSADKTETSSIVTTKSKTTEKTDKIENNPPKISKVFVPCLSGTRQPRDFKEEYQKYSSHPSVTGVFRFPKYFYPGLFETFTVIAQKNEYDLHPLYHWNSGMYAKNTQSKMRFFLQRIDHDDGGTCVRCEVRHEESIRDKDESKEIDQLWKVLLPFLKDAEDVMARFSGLRMERYMECPFCHALSFLGEWMTPKEVQGLTNKTCDICKKEVSTSYLVQPKEKRRVEEFLQKLLQEAGRRRQEASERDKAADLHQTEADPSNPVESETVLTETLDASTDANDETNNHKINKVHRKSPDTELNQERKKAHGDKGSSGRPDKPSRRRSNEDKNGDVTGGRTKHVQSTSAGRNHDKASSAKNDLHLAPLVEEP